MYVPLELQIFNEVTYYWVSDFGRISRIPKAPLTLWLLNVDVIDCDVVFEGKKDLDKFAAFTGLLSRKDFHVAFRFWESIRKLKPLRYKIFVICFAVY
jgi:hypothetical protein